MGDKSRKSQTLSEVMPTEFTKGDHNKTQAFKFKDEIVLKEHSMFTDQDEFRRWPGKQKNVYFWVELENGYAVGWNENTNKGWSFPSIKLSSKI